MLEKGEGVGEGWGQQHHCSGRGVGAGPLGQETGSVSHSRGTGSILAKTGVLGQTGGNPGGALPLTTPPS